MYLVNVEKPSSGGYEKATNWNSTIFPTQIKRIIDTAHSITLELENQALEDSVLGSKYHFRDSIKSRITLNTKLSDGAYRVNSIGTDIIEVEDEVGIEEGMYLVECNDQSIYGSLSGLKIKVLGIENNAENHTHNIRLDTISLADTSTTQITTYTFAYGEVYDFNHSSISFTGSINSDGTKTYTLSSPIGSDFSQDNPPDILINGVHKSKAIIKSGVNSVLETNKYFYNY